MATTLDGTNLGVIKRESVDHVGNIVGMALYSLNSNQNEAFDFGGATKIITVEGSKTDSNEANLLSFIQGIENHIGTGPDGRGQEHTIVYSSDFRGNLNVKVMEVRSSKDRPNTIDYNIKLIEAAQA